MKNKNGFPFRVLQGIKAYASQNYESYPNEEGTETLSGGENPETIFAAIESLQKLNRKPKLILQVILESDDEALTVRGNRICKRKLRKILLSKGWSYPEIRQAFCQISKNFQGYF